MSGPSRGHGSSSRRAVSANRSIKRQHSLTGNEDSKKQCIDLTEMRCCLCLSHSNDELKFGKKLQKDSVVAHYYCLLYACGLVQRGSDTDDLLGFLVEDIKQEVNRGSKLKCKYCFVNGAVSACSLSRCRATFHYDCGMNNSCLYQAFGKFLTFCIDHRPRQNFKRKKLKNEECAICYVTITESDIKKQSFDFFLTPCCDNCLHFDCLQKYSISSGYYFKCPLCKNRKAFLRETKKYGIFTPEQDASWELEENAYTELNQPHETCDMPVCQCSEGRNFDDDDSLDWRLILCSVCASHGAHFKCCGLKTRNPKWICDICENVINPKPENTPSNSQSTAHQPATSSTND